MILYVINFLSVRSLYVFNFTKKVNYIATYIDHILRKLIHSYNRKVNYIQRSFNKKANYIQRSYNKRVIYIQRPYTKNTVKNGELE